MYIAALSYLFTFLIASISCQCCPDDTIPYGTICCDPLSRLQGGSFCTDTSKSLCCLNGWHASNSICWQGKQENCEGECCRGACLTLPKPRIQLCWYTTDVQCKNIGTYALCMPDGGCPKAFSRCDGQCCHPFPH